MLKTCKYCSKEFESRTKMGFCSPECSKEGKTRNMDRITRKEPGCHLLLEKRVCALRERYEKRHDLCERSNFKDGSTSSVAAPIFLNIIKELTEILENS